MFQQGQKVVCIDDNFPSWARAIYNSLPVKDTVYTVRNVMIGVVPVASIKTDKMPTFIGKPDVTITLNEITNPPYGDARIEPGFKEERFREVETTSVEEIMKVTEVITMPVKQPKRVKEFEYV